MHGLKVYFVLLGLFLWNSPQVWGQLFPRMKNNMQQASMEDPHLIIGLDSRRSFIENRDVKFFGARVGVEFDRRWRVGVGWYGLVTPFERNFPVGDTSIRGRLNFNYVAWFFEYVPFSEQKVGSQYPRVSGSW